MEATGAIEQGMGTVDEEERRRVRQEIEQVKGKIEEVENEIKMAKAKGDKEEVKQLRDELKQLRDKELKLMDKELKLMDRQSSLAEGTAGAGVVMEYLKEMKNSNMEYFKKIDKIEAAVSERLSATRQASKIKETELEMVLEEMKLMVVKALDSPSLDELFVREVADGDVTFRGKELEPQQRDAYATRLEGYLAERPEAPDPFKLKIVPAKHIKEFSMIGIPFPIRGKNDELIVPQRYQADPDRGALLGIELKKRISPGDLLQAQAEWLLYAPKSEFPYIQLVTDMDNGGVAYYFAGKGEDGYGRLEYRVLVGMTQFGEFVRKMTAEMPLNIGDDAPNKVNLVLPKESYAAKRFKFTHKRSPENAYNILANYFNNIDDVANLADLEGFPEIDMVGPVDNYPSYFS